MDGFLPELPILGGNGGAFTVGAFGFSVPGLEVATGFTWGRDPADGSDAFVAGRVVDFLRSSASSRSMMSSMSSGTFGALAGPGFFPDTKMPLGEPVGRTGAEGRTCGV